MTDDAPRYDGKTAPELASEAEESLRGIIHLAEAYNERLSAETVYRTLSALTRALEPVPDVVTRLREASRRWHEDERLTVLTGQYAGDPQAAVDAMNEAIDAMLAAFGPVRLHLTQAQAALAGVRDE